MTVVCTKCGALSIAQGTCSVITHNQYVYGGAIQMTDISNLKPGDALTYEQAMALPDGDVVSAIWGGSEVRMYFTVGSKDPFGDPRKFGGSILEREEYWSADRWHSVRLESLPEPAKQERQASEIEKRAALTALGPLFEDCHDAMRDAMDERDYDYLYDFWTNVEGVFRRYREMYDYAKSIGAIE